MRILKSMPIVVMKDGVKESSLKRRRQHDLPTPESPISKSLIYPTECMLAYSQAIFVISVIARDIESQSYTHYSEPKQML